MQDAFAGLILQPVGKDLQTPDATSKLYQTAGFWQEPIEPK